MTKPIDGDPIYRKRAFDADIIELRVRWYISYRLLYRDLVKTMGEGGVKVAHSIILLGDPIRFTARETLEPIKRANGTSWRVDETYITIKAKWHYLHRAVDKEGKPVDLLLRRDCGFAAAEAFFRMALKSARWAVGA